MRIFMFGLFLVMLVLFMREKLKDDNDNYNNADILNDIKQVIENSSDGYFAYDTIIQRFKIKEPLSFNLLLYPVYEGSVTEIGKSIAMIMDTLKIKKYENVKYIIIIEGMSTLTENDSVSLFNNHVLSYERALTVKNIWDSNGVLFDSNLVEVLISGIGNKRSTKEKEIQRIIIYIIPEIKIRT